MKMSGDFFHGRNGNVKILLDLESRMCGNGNPRQPMKMVSSLL